MNNPIIQRELVGLLRTRRALALQVIMAACLTLLVVVRWPSEGVVDLTGRQAQQVLRVFGYGLMTMMILLAPVFPATTLVREKQQGTLSLLLNTPMTRWQIMLGKFAGVLGFIGIMLGLSLPAAAACYAMGGIDLWGQLLPMYLVLALAAVQYAAVGLLVSSYAGSVDAALRITYSVVLLMSVVTLGPQQFLHGILSSEVDLLVEWTRSISPVPAIMEAVGHEGVGQAGMIGAGHLVARYCVLAVLSSTALVLWTALRLNQRMFDKARPSGKMTEEQTKGVRLYRRIMFLYDPQRRRGLIGSAVNPVMMKEFRTRRFGRMHWILRTAAGCLILSLGLMLASSHSTIVWGVENPGTIIVILQLALVILITPSLAASLISGERETGGWQLLQMTPLKPRSIILGKLMSVGFTLLMFLIATLPGYVVMYLIDDSQKTKIAMVTLSLLLTSLFALLATAAVSSMFKRTAQATATAYVVLVGLCAGTMLVWLGRDAPFSLETVDAVLKFNPVAGALSLLNVPGFADYHLIPQNWYIMAGASLACLLVLSVRIWRLCRPQ